MKLLRPTHPWTKTNMPLRLGAARAQTGRQGPSRTLENLDVPGRSAVRSGRGALSLRRPDQRRALPRLRHEVPDPGPQARRYRRGRQSRLAQRQGRAQRDPIRRRPPPLPPQIFARPQSDRAGLRQAEDPRPKGRAKDLRRGFGRPQKRPRRSRTKRMRKLSPARRLCGHLNAEGSSTVVCPRREQREPRLPRSWARVPAERVRRLPAVADPEVALAVELAQLWLPALRLHAV